MELLFKEEILGKIEDISEESFWMYGKFKAYDSYHKYKDFFEIMVSEEDADIEEVNVDFLEETNWFISIDKEIKEISIPAIHSDGCMAFRRR